MLHLLPLARSLSYAIAVVRTKAPSDFLMTVVPLTNSPACFSASSKGSSSDISCTQNNPFSQEFRSLGTFSDPFGDGALSMMKTWLCECGSHGKCTRFLKRPLPTRILDVSDPERAYLRIQPKEEAEYVFFSYFSGNEGRSRVTRTTCMNFEEYRANGIEYSKVSAAWRDAMGITQRLGYKYLWIDALCTVQDDFADWESQNAKMLHYIRNASLVIASASVGATQGFRAPRSANRYLVSLPYSWKPSDRGDKQVGSFPEPHFWRLSGRAVHFRFLA